MGRRHRSISLLAPVLAIALWIAALGFPWGGLPALGAFFSPFEGFWRNAEIHGARDIERQLPGLAEDITIEYDANGIPHVFGGDDLRGLFFAQGYATARDRLWQMDIQSRAGLGRLSEIMGPGLVRFDLERRRMGMPAAARASLDLALEDSLSRVALEAYTDGVNAWVSSLNKRTWPLEFKLLNYAPEPWTPLKSMALIGNMKWTLSQGSDDLRLTHVTDSLGEEFFERHYPDRHPGSEPILPPEVIGGTGYSVQRTEAEAKLHHISGTPSPNTLYPVPVTRLNSLTNYHLTPNPASGSNNFVLSGSRTRTGSPLLANDPHLDLTLPSAWYAIQLHASDLNTMGVSLPGVPGIVIGFTRTTAWGVTNGMSDVFDWVELEFRDSAESGPVYRWNDTWHPVRQVLDTIAVRGEPAVVDTQLWTHLGPVPVHPGEEPFGKNTPEGHALQWTAMQPSNELGAFLRILSATDYPAFREAIAGLHTPSQNFVFAAEDGIAFVHQGRIPIKRAGQGRRLLRSVDSGVEAVEWAAFIPDEDLPATRNPARGWLASANQEVTGPEYPYWLGTHFHPPERSRRLHRLLEPEYAATLEWARQVMFDAYSEHAARALPLLLSHLAPPFSSDSLHQAHARKAEEILRAWDFHYRAPAAAPVYFDLWWKEFYSKAWEGVFDGDTTLYAWPSRPVTRELLAGDSAQSWSERVREAFAAAIDSVMSESSGIPEAHEEIAWGRHRPGHIPHLLRVSPLGVQNLALDGCNECLNAQRGTHGPSWRMVVQLPDSGSGSRPEAWGIYPGGQSGNPGSPNYAIFVDDWASGRLRPLRLRLQPGEIPDSTAWTLTLRRTP